MKMLSWLCSHLSCISLVAELELEFSSYKLLSCNQLCGLLKIKPNLLVLYLSDKRYLKTTKKKKKKQKNFEFVTARFLQEVLTIYSLIHARLSFKDNGGR